MLASKQFLNQFCKALMSRVAAAVGTSIYTGFGRRHGDVFYKQKLRPLNKR
jgi:hypothetical protein